MFLDFDPIRISGKTDDNTTDAEKATALTQSNECVAELSALGWPAPTLVDSGNGFHARYRINLPNNEEATTLVEAVTRTLMARYPLLDMTGCCAMRPAKLPGTWSRKSPHTEERPQRVSALLSEADGTVTLEQLQALAETGTADGHPVETGASEANVVSPEATKVAREYLLDYMTHFGLVNRTSAMRTSDGWKIGIWCPFAENGEHDETSTTGTVLLMRDGKLFFQCSHNTCNERNTPVFKDAMKERNPEPFRDEPGADATVALGGGHLAQAQARSRNWREHYHTRDEVENCADPSFFIDQFLARNSITGIAGPVQQRKSLLALNVIHALLTGKPLFGYFDVLHQPTRVIYLCPEMGLISMSKRIKASGLSQYVGDTFYFQSMNLENTSLDSLSDEELGGSVLVLDAAIRFVAGDEDTSSAMKLFSRDLFKLSRRIGEDGAIVVLYHSPKSTADADELTLENSLRGSGELGAGLTDCHGTRMNKAANVKTFDLLSYITHLKKRDYEGSDDFEVSCDRDTCLMTRMEGAAVLRGKNRGAKVLPDDAAARAYVAEHLNDTVPELIAGLKGLGIHRKDGWTSNARRDARLAASVGRGNGSKAVEDVRQPARKTLTVI
jgi:hypothetical protein